MSPRLKVTLFVIAALLGVLWFLKSKGKLPTSKMSSLASYINDLDPKNTPQTVLTRPQ
jgi:hypothetical protein